MVNGEISKMERRRPQRRDETTLPVPNFQFFILTLS